MTIGKKLCLGFGLSFFLVVVLGCYSIISNINSIWAYSEYAETQVGQTNLVRSLQVDFKKQVQEWKDVLLRGHNPEDLKKYKGQFDKQYNLVERSMEGLRTGPYRFALAENKKRVCLAE